MKVALAKALNDFLDPIRERREHYKNDMPYVEDVLMQGVRRGSQHRRRNHATCPRRDAHQLLHIVMVIAGTAVLLRFRRISIQRCNPLSPFWERVRVRAHDQ